MVEEREKIVLLKGLKPGDAVRHRQPPVVEVTEPKSEEPILSARKCR